MARPSPQSFPQALLPMTMAQGKWLLVSSHFRNMELCRYQRNYHRYGAPLAPVVSYEPPTTTTTTAPSTAETATAVVAETTEEVFLEFDRVPHVPLQPPHPSIKYVSYIYIYYYILLLTIYYYILMYRVLCVLSDLSMEVLANTILYQVVMTDLIILAACLLFFLWPRTLEVLLQNFCHILVREAPIWKVLK